MIGVIYMLLMMDIDKKIWRSQNNILEIFIYLIIFINIIKVYII